MNPGEIEEASSHSEEAHSRVLDAAQAEARLAESRRRLQARIGEIGEAVDREVETAKSVRDGVVAMVGVAATLLVARSFGKAISRRRRKRKKRKS